jgi:hypothetical protein
LWLPEKLLLYTCVGCDVALASNTSLKVITKAKGVIGLDFVMIAKSEM